MRPVLSVVCLALLSFAAACSETTATTKTSPLAGEWLASRESLQPTGSLTRRLGFSNSGQFSYRIDQYGIYEGQSPGTVSVYTQMSGTYQIDGDRLILTANRIATWDSFYGAGSPERVEQVTRVVLDQARFRIVGFTLILDYIVYPADGPVPATLAFTRLGPD